MSDGADNLAPFDVARDIRREVVIKLLDKGTPSTRLENQANKLVDYIINGKKNDPNLVKKIEIKLMDNQPTDAHAYLFDDNTMQIEFADPEALESLFALMDMYGISFYGIPANRVDTTEVK